MSDMTVTGLMFYEDNAKVILDNKISYDRNGAQISFAEAAASNGLMAPIQGITSGNLANSLDQAYDLPAGRGKCVGYDPSAGDLVFRRNDNLSVIKNKQLVSYSGSVTEAPELANLLGGVDTGAELSRRRKKHTTLENASGSGLLSSIDDGSSLPLIQNLIITDTKLTTEPKAITETVTTPPLPNTIRTNIASPSQPHPLTATDTEKGRGFTVLQSGKNCYSPASLPIATHVITIDPERSAPKISSLAKSNKKSFSLNIGAPKFVAIQINTDPSPEAEAQPMRLYYDKHKKIAYLADPETNCVMERYDSSLNPMEPASLKVHNEFRIMPGIPCQPEHETNTWNLQISQDKKSFIACNTATGETTRLPMQRIFGTPVCALTENRTLGFIKETETYCLVNKNGKQIAAALPPAPEEKRNAIAANAGAGQVLLLGHQDKMFVQKFLPDDAYKNPESYLTTTYDKTGYVGTDATKKKTTGYIFDGARYTSFTRDGFAQSQCDKDGNGTPGTITLSDHLTQAAQNFQKQATQSRSL
jgi:hypothetical protein